MQLLAGADASPARRWKVADSGEQQQQFRCNVALHLTEHQRDHLAAADRCGCGWVHGHQRVRALPPIL